MDYDLIITPSLIVYSLGLQWAWQFNIIFTTYQISLIRSTLNRLKFDELMTSAWLVILPIILSFLLLSLFILYIFEVIFIGTIIEITAALILIIFPLISYLTNYILISYSSYSNLLSKTHELILFNLILSFFFLFFTILYITFNWNIYSREIKG